MPRAAGRPVAAGRLHPDVVMVLAVVAAGLGLGLLGTWVNPWTTVLGAAAWVIYVGIYTPLKRRTPWAAIPGAVAGAAPPLMGWTAATGHPGVPGLALFALLLIWQLPHVLAISLRHEGEYSRAGLWVPSMVLGAERTRLWIFLTCAATVSLSLVLGVLGMAGGLYLGFAAAGGGALVVVALQGLEREVGPGWPRRMQRWTVVYLPLIALGLSLDWLLT